MVSYSGSCNRDVRLQAIIDYAEWLQENDWDENPTEVAKRLGCMKGDVNAMIYSMDDDE